MTQYPSIEEAESLTDWVITMAGETGVDAYKLWVVANRLARPSQEPADTARAGPSFDDLLGEVEQGATTVDAEAAPGGADAEVAPSQPVAEAGGSATHPEYEQFQEKVRDVIENLIEFLIAYDMLSDGEAAGGADVRQELEELASQYDADAASFFNKLKEVLEDATGEPADVDADEIPALLSALQQSIDDLEGIIDEEHRGADSQPAAESPPAAAAEGQDIRTLLGGLNRLLDGIDEYPGLDTTPREEPEPRYEPRPEEPPYPEAGYEGYPEEGEPYYEEDERYYEEEPYDYARDWAPEEAPAAAARGFTEYESERRRYDRVEERESTSFMSSIGIYPIDVAWIGAAFTYGGTDMFSTAMVLQAGGRELNPMFGLLGDSLASFVLWKTFVLFALFVMFYPNDQRRPSNIEWFVPMLVTAAGVILTISNLYVLIG